MLLGTVSLVVGIVIGVVILRIVRPREAQASTDPSLAGWLTLGLGMSAILLFALAGWLSGGRGEPAAFWYLSMICMAASLVAGAGGVMRRERHWPFWAGLVAGAIPAIFWVLFIAGAILNPE